MKTTSNTYRLSYSSCGSTFYIDLTIEELREEAKKYGVPDKLIEGSTGLQLIDLLHYGYIG